MTKIKSVVLGQMLKYDLVRIGQDFFSEKTHSIVELSEDIKIETLKSRRQNGSTEKKLVSKEGDSKVSLGWNAPPKNGEYLREWFLLIEKEEKLDYIWVILKNQMEHLLKRDGLNIKFLLPDVQNGIAGSLKNEDKKFSAVFASNCLNYEPSFKDKNYLESFVEIESQFNFPLDSMTGFPHIEFIRWFRDEICSPKIVICGGNEYQIRLERQPGLNWDWDIGNLFSTGETPIALDRSDHWFLWPKKSGVKIKIPKSRDFRISRSAIPDSLEIKISNMDGLHAKYVDVDPWDIASAIDQLGAVEVSIADMNPQDWADLWLMLDKLYSRVRVKIKVDRINRIPDWKLNLLDEIELHFDSLTALNREISKAIGSKKERDGNLECLSNFRNPWLEKLTVYVDMKKFSAADAVKALSICKKNDLESCIGYQDLDEETESCREEIQKKLEVIKRSFTGRSSGTWLGPKIKMLPKMAALWDSEDRAAYADGDGVFSIFMDIFEMNFSRSSRKDSEKFKIKKSNLRYGRWRPDIDDIMKTYNSWSSDESKLER